MTELEKKAEKYQTGRKDLNYFSEPYKDKIRKAYIAGAKAMQEETLKEIIEIEKVSDYRWEENQQIKQENEQLKAQIEKMKCCWNCKHPAKDSTGCCCPFAASCHNRSLWKMDAD